jgi:hypothetical protein
MISVHAILEVEIHIIYMYMSAHATGGSGRQLNLCICVSFHIALLISVQQLVAYLFWSPQQTIDFFGCL